MQDTAMLTEQEILGIAPRELLLYVVKGVKSVLNFSVGVILNVDEEDDELSMGTGKVSVTAVGELAQGPCKFIRDHEDAEVRNLCSKSDKCAFDKIKFRCDNGNVSGRKYRCTALDLWEYAAPIYDQESKTFIGAVLGGQRYEGENKEEFVNKVIKQSSVLEKYRDQLLEKFESVSVYKEKEFLKLQNACDKVATDITNIFRFYITQKTRLVNEEMHRLTEEKYHVRRQLIEENIALINEKLIKVQSLERYWAGMTTVAEDVFNCLPIDWCLILKQNTDKSGRPSTGVEVVGRPNGCRGLKHRSLIATALKSAGPFQDKEDVNHFFQAATKDLTLSPDAQCLGFPVKDNTKIIAILLVGSAPGHRNANSDFSTMDQYAKRVDDITLTMGMEYSELAAIEREKQRANELQIQKVKLDNQVEVLEDTLMSLNHQMHGPLWMLSNVLTNVRDCIPDVANTVIKNELEVGILVARHASLLSDGMASMLASEQKKSAPKGSVKSIDVQTELEELSESITKSFQCMHRKIEVRLNNTSPVKMRRLDFLFVFYLLLENALKYGFPDKPIIIECSLEKKLGRDCFKLRSWGRKIESQDRENVFRKFWRHKDAWKSYETGLGVGCWAARECMRYCGGDLYLEVFGVESIFVIVPPPSE